MERHNQIFFSWKILTILTLSFVLTNSATAQQFSIEDLRLSPQEDVSKLFSKKGTPGGMWFGPRLGKRTHHSGYSGNLGTPLQKLLLEAMIDPKKLEDYTDIRPISTNTKRRFTPRLGRESGEEIQGMRNVDFIPRLGRELDPHVLAQLLASEECNDPALFGRGLPETVAFETKTPPFAPRLGRENNMASFYVSLAVTQPPPCCGGNPPAFSNFGAPPFIPRLGRDSQNYYDSSLDSNTYKDGGLRIARSAPNKHQETPNK